jgi:transposase
MLTLETKKEQRASKSNARLSDLNCSKCGQLFSSAIGFKKRLKSAGDNICQRVAQTLQKGETFIRLYPQT